MTISLRCQRTGTWPAAPKIDGDQTPELQEPTLYRLVRHVGSSLRQQILDVTKRQREPSIEPYRMLDDFRQKTTSLE